MQRSVNELLMAFRPHLDAWRMDLFARRGSLDSCRDIQDQDKGVVEAHKF
jgi:hypothetical protein